MRLWTDDGAAAQLFRAATWPLSLAYRVAVATRNTLYDRHWFATRDATVPVVSIGNLTVGGTGKTPFAAWLATRLATAARPAVVIRGYGSDEVAVHRLLNPDIPVVVNADRVAGIREAFALGADIAVLDDAFQHRRVARDADLLLVSAEQVARGTQLLPSGPWREPVAAARRATLVVITRKSADDGAVARARALVTAAAPGTPIAVVRLAPAALIGVNGTEERPLADLAGRGVLAICGIGDPEAFAAQLGQLGARVHLAAFRDHHAFTAADAARLVGEIPPGGDAVCTLKDAVKLRAWWPAPSRLWYVSQRVAVEDGESELARVIERLLVARVPRGPNTTRAG